MKTNDLTECDEYPNICPNCKRNIDKNICWCGDEIKSHGILCDHMPVPIGCVCYFSKKENKEFDKNKI